MSFFVAKIVMFAKNVMTNYLHAISKERRQYATDAVFNIVTFALNGKRQSISLSHKSSARLETSLHDAGTAIFAPVVRKY